MEQNYDSSSEEEILYQPQENYSYEDLNEQEETQKYQEGLIGSSVQAKEQNSVQSQYQIQSSLQKEQSDSVEPAIQDSGDIQPISVNLPRPTKLQQGLLKQNFQANQISEDPIQAQINQEAISQKPSELQNRTTDHDKTFQLDQQGSASPNKPQAQQQNDTFNTQSVESSSPKQQKFNQNDSQQKASKKSRNRRSQNRQPKSKDAQFSQNLPSEESHGQKEQQQTSQIQMGINNLQLHSSQSEQQGYRYEKSYKGSQQKQDKKPDRKKNRKIYLEHLSKKDLATNLSLGRAFQGSYRVNQKNHQDGYVQVEGLPHQVLVKGLRNQNRAIDGDVVVIQVLEVEQWFVYKSLPGHEGSDGDATTDQGQTDKEVSPRKAPSIPVPKLFTGDNKIQVNAQDQVSDRDPLVLGTSPNSNEGNTLLVQSQKKSPREIYDMVGNSSGNDTDVGGGQGYLETIREEAESVMELEEQSSFELENEDEFDDLNPDHMRNKQNQISGESNQMQEGRGKEEGNRRGSPRKQNRGGRFRQQQQHQQRGEASWWQAESQEDAIKQISEILVKRQLEGKCQIRVTGTIVGIVEYSNRREHVVGSILKIFSGAKNWTKEEPPPITEGLLQVKCIDPRVPSLLLVGRHLQNLPSLLDLDFSDLKNKILFGKISRWSTSDLYPTFHVASVIGQRGILGDELKAILFQEQIDWNQYPENVMGSLDLKVGPITEKDLRERRDYRDKVVFTIDPLTAKDLDDAISIEKLEGKEERYLVQVHIADVSQFVPTKSALNEEAENRATSVYLVNSVIPMLPPKLCEHLCSLNPGKDSLTYTIEWEMDLEGQVYSVWVGRSIINSCVKTSYNLVQEMIESRFDHTQQYFGYNDLEVPKIQRDDIKWPKIVDDCLLLHTIAQNLRKKRYDNGALRLDLSKLYFDINKEGLPQGLLTFEQKESNQLIEEFALKANMTVAGMVSSTFPQNSLLRNHPAPDPKITEIVKIAQGVGIDIKVNTSKEIQESLLYVRREYPDLLEAFTSLLVKPMKNASYISTGSSENEDPLTWHHYALCVPFYTHFTSPIRRYPDIVVHRLLTAALQKKAILKQLQSKQPNSSSNSDNAIINQTTDSSATATNGVQTNGHIDVSNSRTPIDTANLDRLLLANNGLPDAKFISEQCAHYNGRKLAAKSAQEKCIQLYLLHHLCVSPTIVKAVVTRLGGCHFCQVYVPHIGQELRVKLNALNVNLLTVLVPNKCVYINIIEPGCESEAYQLEGEQFTHRQEILRSTIKAELQPLDFRVGQDKMIKNRRRMFQRNKKQPDSRRPRKGGQTQEDVQMEDALVSQGSGEKPSKGSGSQQDSQQLNWQQQLLQQKYGMEIEDQQVEPNEQNEINDYEAGTGVEGGAKNGKSKSGDGIRYFNQYTNSFNRINNVDQYNLQQQREQKSKLAEVKLWEKILKGEVKNQDTIQPFTYPLQLNQFQEVPVVLFPYMSDDEVTPRQIGAVLYITQPDKDASN